MSAPKIPSVVLRLAVVAVLVGGLAAFMLLQGSSGGGVDLFTEDLASEGIDAMAFVDSDEVEGAAAQPLGDAVDGSVQIDPTTGAIVPEEFPSAIGDDIGPTANAGDEGALIEASDVVVEEAVADLGDPVEVDRVEATTQATTPSLTNVESPFVSPVATPRIAQTSEVTGTPTNRFSPAPITPAVTPETGTTTFSPEPPAPVADRTPTSPATVNSPAGQTSPAVDPTPHPQPADPVLATTTTTTTTTVPVPVAPTGPWCQIEVRQNDGIIRWEDEGRTTVFRLNDRWFHTPDVAAQAVQIPDPVNTNDQYVMRLWVGGTTDVPCTFVTSAEVFQAPAQTATPTSTPTAVANVATLPAPIAVPGGPVQIGFSADLWAEDRAQYWSDLQAVPGTGRLIAHEFKSFDKPINTSLFRWHQESGRDLLLTWNGTDAETILNGSNDDWIREHARELRSLPDTVMLRFWHEPDVQHKREWIDHDPQQFIDSWIYVRQIFAEENATNIEWVWCPTAWNWNEQGARYYPGDANVDWICSDGYSGWDLDAPLPHIRDAYTDFQAWANQRPHKPILIAEFGAGQRGPGERAEWVQGIDDWVAASPNIRAVIYFDVDRRPHGEIYDWRLRTEPDAWAAMLDIITSAPFGR